MSVVEGPPHGHEIIIIRRNHDHEEGHHGGAWKIAFADFMTALMCFFLVMWLINAANEETKAAVASYFNPVKLTDRNSSRKSLADQGNGPLAAGTVSEDQENSPVPKQDQTAPTAGQADQTVTSDPIKESRIFTDQNLFSDPYAVLAEIAAETGNLQNMAEKGEGGAQDAGPATGASGGESYRDPFAPDFWSKQVAKPEDAGENPRDGYAELSANSNGSSGPAAQPSAAAESFPEAPPAPAAKPLPDLPALAPAPEEEAVKVEAPTASSPESSAVAEKAAAIRAQLEQALASDPRLLMGMTVEATEGGVLISVTDKENYGMFAVGSAVPGRDLVLGMEKIAKVVESQKGPVTIKGHTDGRPFRSETYDNWRLSTARAHSAYYMLVRAGLDEKRVREVAGFADRQLKVPGDPLSDTNRRIEILVGVGE
ncbi:MAG TPA: MotB family protein [Tianweitania sediminis]|nr:MotB family protein [Tianweitania sediminis]